jgi:hypothetical protein
MSKHVLRLFAISVAAAAATSAGPAHAQSAADITRQVVNSAVQSVIQSIRDQLQSRRTPAPGTLVTRFTDADLTPNQPVYDDAFGALGFARSPMVTKAAPMPMAAAPPPQWGVWGTGAFNWQRSTISGTSSTAETWSAVGGADYTKIGVLTSSDALVIGVDGSGAWTHTSTGVNVTTPSVGAFSAYVNGGFSTDFSFLAAFSDSSIPGVAGFASTSEKTDSYSYTGDLQYKFELMNAWWVEPTVGATYANTFFNTPGAGVGEVFTVQGGGRFGTEFVDPTGVKIQPIFLGLIYSNVVEKTGGVAGAPPVGLLPSGVGLPVTTATGTDKGQIWLKGDAKLNFVFNQYFSAYVEGIVYGTHGNLNALGAGALVGARWVF